MQKIKISILGCGWLGIPLAEVLLEENFGINGSTTSVRKLISLENIGIQPFLISLNTNEIHGNIRGFLEKSKILIINIPPKLRSPGTENFTEKIKNLIPYIENTSIENVLFISSTSVYADDNSNVTEETIPIPNNESGRQLLEAEALLHRNPNFKTTILRFGGLVGEDRHPVHFLSGRSNVQNPDAPINLIHKVDCIAIILKIIAMGKWDETFNAAAPFHPSREKYYTEKAAFHNLALPHFSHQKISEGKVIDSSKVKRTLKYEFLKPEL